MTGKPKIIPKPLPTVAWVGAVGTYTEPRLLGEVPPGTTAGEVECDTCPEDSGPCSCVTVGDLAEYVREVAQWEAGEVREEVRR